METSFRKLRRKARSEEELIVAVKEEWEQLYLAPFDKLADSLQEQFSAVIKPKGGHISWRIIL